MYGQNSHGLSAASPVSNAFRPCGSLFECQPALPALLAGVIGLVLLALAVGAVVWSRNRARRHITVEIDDLGTYYLGLGPSVGASLLRDRYGRIRGVMPGDRRSEFGVRHRGKDRFTVTAAGTSTDVMTGEPTTVVDNEGQEHQLVVRHWGSASAHTEAYDFEPSGRTRGRR